MASHANMRLGKRAPRLDVRTLKLARYLTPDLPPAPTAVDWSVKVTNLGPMLNQELGDCTIAAAGHLVQCWTAANGAQVTPTDADILAAYEGACGYDPADPSSDQGGIELDVLTWWRKNGLAGHKIAAFATLDLSNEEHFRQAIYLFGGVYVGVALSISNQNQDIWSVAISGDQGDPRPGSWGLHAIPVIGYNAATGLYRCITWGAPKDFTFDWGRASVDEGYVVLGQDWANGTKVAPSGLALSALLADVAAVTA